MLFAKLLSQTVNNYNLEYKYAQTHIQNKAFIQSTLMWQKCTQSHLKPQTLTIVKTMSQTGLSFCWFIRKTHTCIWGEGDQQCLAPGKKQHNVCYVSKSHPWFSIQVNWQRCANRELNVPAVFWTWLKERCTHPETGAHWYRPPACNYLTASPPTKAKQLTSVQFDESAI